MGAAVGYAASGTLVETWNGVAWTTATSPDPSPLANCSDCNFLYGVSCPAALACTTVGTYFGGDNINLGLIVTEEASGWVLVSGPQQSLVSDVLHGVSCVSSSQCFAVGQFTDNGGNSEALIESWNGSTWTALPGSGSFNVLNGVSCPSATMCMAVGPTNELWNGRTWGPVPNPSDGGATYSVSCVSASMCAAVGVGRGSALTQTWNGAAWSVAPSPTLGFGTILYGVSCVSASDCVAVGTTANFSKTLVESWDVGLDSRAQPRRQRRQQLAPERVVRVGQLVHGRRPQGAA